MQLTVGDIVALPLVQVAVPEVVAPAELDQAVRWVHVSELDDLSALLQGGELILTTGLGIGPTEADQREYLHNLSHAGAAGLVLELGRCFEAAPRGLARAARTLGFPLVVLHRPLRFVALTEEVHGRIISEQIERLSFSERVHRTFSELTVEAADTGEILGQARVLASAPIVLEDLGHRVLSYDLGTAPATQVLHQWERRSRAAGDGASTPLGNERWTACLVGPRGRAWGRLVLIGSSLADDAALTVLERTAQALTITRLLERDRRGHEHRTHAGLLAELLAGRATEGPDLRSRATSAGLAPGGPYLPMTLVQERTDSAASGAENEPGAEPVSQVRDLVAGIARDLGQPVLVASTRPGTVTAVLAVSRDEQRVLTRFAEGVHARVGVETGLGRWMIGVGRSTPSLADIGPLIDESAHAADAAAAQPARARRRLYYRSADIRLRGVLSALRDDPRWVGFAEAELGPLLAYDAKQGTDLIALLGEFLRHGGNKAQLARRSHLSRPALYSRLATIESVLDVDLADAESRVSLHVAILLRELRGARSD